MITGMHALIYTEDADGVRAFFRDVLGFPHVDGGDGWLIFALPPSEIAVHPSDSSGAQELYLLCDDITATVEELTGKGVEFTGPVQDRGWGLDTTFRIPGGAELHVYQPKHPTTLDLPRAR
jgi:catechol 2,3-dioxygenase-like lactoylglutathione lyase family enzyme